MKSTKLLAVLISISTIGLCSIAYADPSTGFYIGAQAGYGQTDPWNNDVFSGKSSDNGGFAGRPYAGFQLNQYFGAETGYTFFTSSGHHSSGSTDQWDALLKAGLPFGNGFRGDIKAGGAYIMPASRDHDYRDMDNANFSHFNSSNNSDFNSFDHHGNDNTWEPAAGLGFSYNLNRGLALDISYLHGFGSNGHDGKVATDFIGLGASYNFN